MIKQVVLDFSLPKNLDFKHEKNPDSLGIKGFLGKVDSGTRTYLRQVTHCILGASSRLGDKFGDKIIT